MSSLGADIRSRHVAASDETRKWTQAGPSDVYCTGPVLAGVQNAGIYNDSKTFVDMKMKQPPEVVVSTFVNMTSKTPEDIQTFVEQHFDGPGTEFEDWIPTDWSERPAFLDKIKDTQLKHWGSELNKLWKNLGRKIKDTVKNTPDQHSLIYLAQPFIVPGGRFREVYYWDSYWVVNGLLLSGMYDTVKGMILNFLELVETYGFVPNGGRIYYTRRSQPPFLIPIMKQYYEATSDKDFLRQHIATLEKEYQFWINNRTVSVTRDGVEYRLARYAVDIGQPRPESYREDEETAIGASDTAALYSDIASAAETGWDFSTRWFAPGNKSMASIRTRNIVPVDLNGDGTKGSEYQDRFLQRQLAIEKVLWDDDKGIWFDFDLERNVSNVQFYASNIFPLWAGCYGGGSAQERRVLDYLKAEGVLDYPGGVPTSKLESGQQWDFPNAWPPLQQIFIWALDSSTLPEAKEYAKKLAQRWILTNWRSWIAKGHMYEKYDATIEGLPGRGGEYEVQLGFGWTNGVAMQILDKYGSTLKADNSTNDSTKLMTMYSVGTILFAIAIYYACAF